MLGAAAGPSRAAARGIAIHRLLQLLPDLPQDRREVAARRYLAYFGADWPEPERLEAWAAARAVLEDDRFGPLFSPGSRAEVSLMGTLEVRGKPRAVSGKIDRLAVSSEKVLIVDYKTNRPPPSRADEVPQAHVAQMALYRALLAPLYPGRTVAAALLFTEGPILLDLPAAVLDDVLARLAAA